MDTVINVLIVEDNAVMRAYIKEFVTRHVRNVGTILEAADGKEAIEQYRARRPDWVVMDIQMSEVDGITATEAIRAMDEHAKVIILTAFDDKRFRAAARKAGVVAYVLKENLREIAPLLEAR
jgi:DNA-binding NarL/FixJ family response regulator